MFETQNTSKGFVYLLSKHEAHHNVKNTEKTK
jgi:hypothetical protein